MAGLDEFRANALLEPQVRTALGIPRVRILGVEIDSVTMAGAVHAFEQMIRRGRPSLVFNVNVDICMQIRRDPDLARVFKSADLVLVDGTPMMWAARFLESRLPERVSGSDFISVFSEAAARTGYRLFLLGAAPGVAERAKAVLEGKHPGLQVVDTYSPPYGFEYDAEENAKIVARVKRAAPDVLFTAFGVPKDQKWLSRFSTDLGVPVSMGLGSSFDYLAGRLRRAPKWMQGLGLEWSFRLVQEPGRLWRRYLINDFPFVYYVLRERVRIHRGRRAGYGA